MLKAAGPLRVLTEPGDIETWSSIIHPLDPEFTPRVLVPLDGVGRPRGFILLGNLRAGGVDPSRDHSRCSALAGLIGIINAVRGVADSNRGARASGAGLRRSAPAAGTNLGELRDLEPALQRFVGSSPAVERILYDVIGVAGTNCPVLFEGESGTGKEQLARIIHLIAYGERAPFEALNCGAIPEALVESELFGHVQGAFTGANRRHRGVFERANGGTVFLDEIAEMPPAAQVKLLRVLQEGAFSPVGGEDLCHCSCRIIAATNRDLHREVEARRFRQDLFYRLNVFPIRTPPLRERREDIPALVQEFLKQSAAETGLAPLEVDEDAMRRLSIYSYPGNVRELQNIVRTLLVEARGATITDPHVAAVFSRHRVTERPTQDEPEPGADERPSGGEDVGGWVLVQLRRYFFNLALTERMLEERRRAGGGRGGVPVSSRSGLTYYFQGECLRALAETGWDRQAAAARIAGRDAMTMRVRRALDHLLDGALGVLERGGETAEARVASLQTRWIKLPEFYQGHVRRLSERYEAGVWP
jgi:transcriptional regulator with GAF, ATPase, and Fis domain